MNSTPTPNLEAEMISIETTLSRDAAKALHAMLAFANRPDLADFQASLDRALRTETVTRTPVPAASSPEGDAVSARLAEMLRGDAVEDSEIVAGEAPAPRRETVTRTRPSGTVNPEMTPANGYSGRGNSGRLRNFAAMNDAKLEAVARQVRYEGDDGEAIAAINAEMEARGL